MDSRLLMARRKFQGQKAKVESSSFDNSPFTEGIATIEIVNSELREYGERPSHYVQGRITSGPDEGRTMFLYGRCWLDDVLGITRSATDIRRILGEESVPGSAVDGQFEIDLGAYLENFDELSARMIGEVIEAKCVNSKPRADGSHLKDDGTPWQNWYVQRGLGDDAKGILKVEPKTTHSTLTPSDNMKVAKKKKGILKVEPKTTHSTLTPSDNMKVAKKKKRIKK